MYTRTDETDAAVSVAATYYTAMVDADAAALRQVFHPKASIIGNLGPNLEFASLEQFIATTKDAKTGDKPFEYHVDGIVTVGDTAVITVSGYCYSTWFTDHLSMVKIDNTWKIVAKTFFAHP